MRFAGVVIGRGAEAELGGCVWAFELFVTMTVCYMPLKVCFAVLERAREWSRTMGTLGYTFRRAALGRYGCCEVCRNRVTLGGGEKGRGGREGLLGVGVFGGGGIWAFELFVTMTVCYMPLKVCFAVLERAREWNRTMGTLGYTFRRAALGRYGCCEVCRNRVTLGGGEKGRGGMEGLLGVGVFGDGGMVGTPPEQFGAGLSRLLFWCVRVKLGRLTGGSVG